MKLIAEEAESEALWRERVGWDDPVTSQLGEIETYRAVRRLGEARARTVAVLGPVTIVPIDDDVRRLAAALDPPELRTLDAVHVATALSLGSAVEAVVTYDGRLAAAAEASGLTVLSPS